VGEVLQVVELKGSAVFNNKLEALTENRIFKGSSGFRVIGIGIGN
jgi:hypothetical protein